MKSRFFLAFPNRTVTQAAIEVALATALPHLQQHQKPLTAMLGVMLAIMGATALGIAPPDSNSPSARTTLITEVVQPTANLAQQTQALADTSLVLYRSDVMRSNDSPTSLFRRLGVSHSQALEFIRTNPTAALLFKGYSRKMVQLKSDSSGQLLELVARYPANPDDAADTPNSTSAKRLFHRLLIQRNEAGAFEASVQLGELQSQTRIGSGTIRSSLFAATDEAQVPDAIATQMAELFSGDIDFHRQLQRGDSFHIVYETLTADGQPIHWNQGAGRILAAEFVNKGRSYQTVWFESNQPGGRGEYYDAAGNSRRRTFLASPMAFSRVTSGFAMRFHPILQELRAHRGVDYGAPTGTPVRTVANGVVEFAGWQNGYGNTIIIKHTPKQSTVYAHLSKMAVKRGQAVTQGQNIGAVGATGYATGPHLHFEYRVNGQHVDPLTLAREAQTIPLAAQAKPAFMQTVALYQSKLKLAATIQGNVEQAE